MKAAAVPANVPETPRAGVALFDLDGTLLAWDCQLLFRHFVVRREPWRLVFLPLFFAALPLGPLLGAAGLKRVFLSYLCGMSRETLAEHSRDFASFIRPAVYPELLECLEAHRRAGDLTVLTSASPAFYVVEIGRELGFDLALGTPVETGRRCPLFPDLENNKGMAKVRALQKLLPPSYFSDGVLRSSCGYTDSTADLPMLAICGHATLVNPLPLLRAATAGRHGRVFEPRRPWRSKAGFAMRSIALLFGLGRDPGGVGNPRPIGKSRE